MNHPDHHLESRIVALLDVLGFRAHLAKYSSDPDRGLEVYRNAWVAAQPELDSAALKWSRRVLTDNIVLIGDSVGQETESLFDLVLAVGRFQFAFALSGFFVRGGVCISGCFEDAEFVYGPALAEAYDLEQSANVPRVILSKQLADIARQDNLVGGDVTAAQSLDELADENHRLPFVRVQDGVPYLDYLLAAHQSTQDEKVHRARILQHAGQVALGNDHAQARYQQVMNDASASQKKKDDARRLREKYQWLHGYHDSYCRLAGLPDKYSMGAQLA